MLLQLLLDRVADVIEEIIVDFDDSTEAELPIVLGMSLEDYYFDLVNQPN